MWLKITIWVLISLAALFVLAVILLYFFQEKLIFFPEKLQEDYKYRFDRQFTEETFTMPDGVGINALHFTPEKPEGWVFYLHGNAGNLQGWGERAYHFVDNNYGCTIIDYRGYGKSTGEITPENILNDPAIIYNEVRERHKNLPFVLYGSSLGTGIATWLAAEYGSDVLILETPYYNLGDVSSQHYPFIPHNLLLRYTMRTDHFIKKVQSPVYLFHGTKDQVIYYGSSLKLMEILKPGDRLITINNGKHSDLSTYDLYTTELKKILEETTRNAK